MSELTRLTEIINPFDNAPVLYIEQTLSTMKLAESAGEAASGTVYLAGMQTAGRGRIPGRVWEGAKNKNLLFTLVLPAAKLAVKPLSVVVGLGIALYLEKYQNLYPSIKWPNDIYINDRKIAGIIIESRKGLYNIGIGININQTEFPINIESSATSLAIEKSNSFNLYSELENVLVQLEKTLFLDSWHKEISSRLYNIGKEVVLSIGIPGEEKKIKGVIEGIGVSGQLFLRKEGELLEIYSGEVLL